MIRKTAAKAEQERNKLAEMELGLKIAEFESAKQARKAEIIRNMQKTLNEVDAKWENIRANEQYRQSQEQERSNLEGLKQDREKAHERLGNEC